ncbi:MAG: hypothetical protein OT477_02335 [Chloroflexi bacterium]|nr:hypothetical protein [Chloroflexota bacterium]
MEFTISAYQCIDLSLIAPAQQKRPLYGADAAVEYANHFGVVDGRPWFNLRKLAINFAPMQHPLELDNPFTAMSCRCFSR